MQSLLRVVACAFCHMLGISCSYCTVLIVISFLCSDDGMYRMPNRQIRVG